MMRRLKRKLIQKELAEEYIQSVKERIRDDAIRISKIESESTESDG